MDTKEHFKELPENIRPFYKKLRLEKEYQDRDVMAYDTETTSKGNLILLASNVGSTRPYPSFDEILEFLMRNESAKKSLNFFFNIRFDVDAMFKPVSNKIELEDGFWRLRYKNYEIMSFEGKLLKIKNMETKNVKKFWDLAQFLDGSLQSLSKKYLNDVKDDEEIEDKGVMENVDINVLRRYCIKDCILTQRLGLWLFDQVERFSDVLLGYKSSPANWYSKASLAEYFIKRMVPEKVLKPRYSYPILKYAYKSFHGGMFESYVKGRVVCDTIDINSAYPTQIRELLDLSRGKWKRTTKFEPDAYYGFYKCRAKYNGFMPFITPYKVVYPVTNKKYLVYLTQNEIMAYTDIDADIIDGYAWFPEEIEKPFKPVIDKLYDMKKKAKKEKDEPLYWLTKVIMNSIYGKFVQVAGDKAGSLFNPVYGSVITANTRIQIYESMSLFDEVYSIDTDSVTGKLKDPTAIEESDELGKWSIKELGKEKIIIMNGLTVDVDSATGKKDFIDTRGFRKHSAQVLRMDDEKVVLKIKRAKHMRECLRQHRLGDVNRFVEEEKIIDLNASKRVFEQKFSWDGLIWSKPYDDSYIASLFLGIFYDEEEGSGLDDEEPEE